MEQIDRNTSLLHERTMIYLIHVFKGKKYHGNSLEKNVKSAYPSKYKEHVSRFIQHLLVLHFGLQWFYLCYAMEVVLSDLSAILSWFIRYSCSTVDYLYMIQWQCSCFVWLSLMLQVLYINFFTLIFNWVSDLAFLLYVLWIFLSLGPSCFYLFRIVWPHIYFTLFSYFKFFLTFISLLRVSALCFCSLFDSLGGFFQFSLPL